MICFFFSALLPALCAPKIPEETMTTVQLIANAGYPVQEVNSPVPRPTVLLQHGLLASSADWVLNLPEQSLGFLTADAGFDVYLGNVRGNVYSREHVNETIDRKEYWRFSFDEMAEFDLEAMVDKTLSVSGSSHLHYVGYSRGTMMMFARLSKDGQFAKKIKKFFALAPVGELLPEIENCMWGIVVYQPTVRFSSPSSVRTRTRWTRPVCLAAYISHTPAGTSTQNILHWAPMSRSGRTEMYDSGSAGANLRYYGQKTPPQYNLTNVVVPTYHSPADLRSDPEDVQFLTVPVGTIVDNVELRDFNHIDFVYGLRANGEIYDKIIREIKDRESNAIRP